MEFSEAVFKPKYLPPIPSYIGVPSMNGECCESWRCKSSRENSIRVREPSGNHVGIIISRQPQTSPKNMRITGTLGLANHENKDKMDRHKWLRQHPKNTIPPAYDQKNLPPEKPRQKPPNIPKMAKQLVKMSCHPERKVGHVDIRDFQHREVQTLSLYVLLESNKFEKFRTRMHPIYTNKFILYTLLQASEHAIASRLMCKTTWLVDMLAQIMENAETSAVWGNIVFIFRNITLSYVKMEKDRWDYLNQGALKVMCEAEASGSLLEGNIIVRDDASISSEGDAGDKGGTDIVESSVTTGIVGTSTSGSSSAGTGDASKVGVVGPKTHALPHPDAGASTDAGSGNLPVP